jgi:hypothetical protein
MPNKTSTEDAMLQRLDEYARQDPTKAAAAAFGAGFLLNVLPLAP